jgi:hypothetical protein
MAVHVLARNPEVATRAKPGIVSRSRFWQRPDVSPLVHSRRSDDNQVPARRSSGPAAAFPRLGTEPGFGTDFSQVPVHSAARPPSPSAKLSVNKPGDWYEQEADRITEQVVGMPEPRPPQIRMYHEADGAHHLQRAAIARAITPVTPSNASGETSVSDAMASQIASTRGRGSPLPESSRTFMEDRFGTDFSHVRVHTGDYAAVLSGNLGAKAFTVGTDIYLNSRSSFSPESSEGRRLLAHELTHTVQQRTVPNGQLGAQLMIQRTDGDKARNAFGEFEAVKYHPIKQMSDGKEVGVEMFLRFNPGAKVDAKQIALTQAATGKAAGTPAAADPNYGRRSATSGAGKGYFIDVLTGFPSPLYATANQPSPGAAAADLTSYPTVASAAFTPAEVANQEAATGRTGVTRTGFGKHGFRYMEAGHLKGPESAELYDTPTLGAANDSEQIFESTALAIEGIQDGTYYGSVGWGWRRDAAGKFSMVPFRAISQGTPSVNFLTAARIWNTATEDFNWGVSVASTAILDPTNISNTKVTVTRGTALKWGGMQGTIAGVRYNLVTINDGPSRGTSGAIKSSDMAMMDVGRPTVHLPVAEIYTTNAAGGFLVTNPARAATSIVRRLAKGTRVTVMPDLAVKVAAALLGATVDPAWTYVTVADGPDIEKKGWVQKSLLTQETLGTH